MEQPEVCVREYHLVLIGSLDTFLVHHTARRRSKIGNATLPCPVYVIREWEKCITRTCNTIQFRSMLSLLFLAQWGGDILKEAFPMYLFTTFKLLPAHKKIDGICLFRPFDTLFEGEIQNSWMMPKPPVICFRARKTRAMYPRLLSGSKTDYSPSKGIGYAVGLCIFQGQCSNNKIRERLPGDLKQTLDSHCIRTGFTTHRFLRRHDVLE